MESTIWDRKIEPEEVGGIADYNARMIHRPALETPGTDAYYSAVMNAFRRAGEALGTPAYNPPEKPVKLPRARVPAGEVFSGQLCYKCDRRIAAGEELFAVPDWPAVVCADCQPNCRYNNCAVRVMTLDDWSGRVTPRRKKNRIAVEAPVLIRVTAA